MTTSRRSDGSGVVVWGPGIRIAHWLLVAAFTTAYVTEGAESVRTPHVWAGYTALAIVAWRIVWGFVGPRHARFRNFIRGPRAVLQYLTGLVRGSAPHTLGHNPAGGAMVVALLTCLLATTVTGLMVYALEDGRGPLAPVIARAPATAANATGGSDAARSPHPVEADGDESPGVAETDTGAAPEAEESGLTELHERFANLTLVLVLLHVAGVAASSRAHRENLVRAMITGRKRGASRGGHTVTASTSADPAR